MPVGFSVMPSSASMALVALFLLGPPVILACGLVFRTAFRWRPLTVVFAGVLCLPVVLMLSHLTDEICFSVFGYTWMHFVDGTSGIPPLLLGLAEVWIAVALWKLLLSWWDKAVLKLPPGTP